MARPLRIEFPGALYHLTSRGNARQPIYLDDDDRLAFLAVFADVTSAFRWTCHAYCLMGNHYHLVVETAEGGLSRGMRELNGRYAQAFNRRHGRTGHVFQGRYHAVLVDREAYLLEVARYVVLNPVRAGLVTRVDEWPWSSFRATAGLDPCPPWLTVERLLPHWALDVVRARERYAQFVAAGVGGESPWPDRRGGYLGSDTWVERVHAAVAPPNADPEYPKAMRLAGRPPLARLLMDAGLGRRERNAAIRRARLGHGYTIREIAAALGIHGTTVRRALRTAPARPGGNARLQDLTPECAIARPDPPDAPMQDLTPEGIIPG